MPGDTRPARQAVRAAQDRDRHTEVGGPPTGQVPKAGESVVRGMPAARGRAPVVRRWPWFALVAIAVASGGIGGVGAHPLARAGAAVVAPPPPPDASLKDALGTFEIDSVPPGAMVTIAGKPQGAAPRTANVSSGVKIRVKLELKGFQTFEDDFIAEANKTLVIRERLVAAPSTITIETTPAGAQVTAGGQFLGSTPLEKPMPAGKGVEVVITKAGYDPIKLAADLIAGETTSIKRDLRESQKFGFVTINVGGTAGWADVYVKGKKLGRNRTASGLVSFRLPIGTHALRLRTGNGKQKTLNVDDHRRQDGVAVRDVRVSTRATFSCARPRSSRRR